VGGFCAGEREICDHQRLSGLGYCFSASLPPFLATAGIAALDILDQRGPQLAKTVRDNARFFRRLVADIPGLLVVGGESESPLVHLSLDPIPAKESFDAGDLLLHRVATDCLEREGVMYAASKYTSLEISRPAPSLRVAVSAAHSKGDLMEAAEALRRSCRRVLPLL
jgi:serine palmitoyltransferase